MPSCLSSLFSSRSGGGWCGWEEGGGQNIAPANPHTGFIARITNGRIEECGSGGGVCARVLSAVFVCEGKVYMQGYYFVW